MFCFKEMVPSRAVVGIMIFTACLFSYMLRVNMSINLIAMVEPTPDAHTGKAHIPECTAQKMNASSEYTPAPVNDVSMTLDTEVYSGTARVFLGGRGLN